MARTLLGVSTFAPEQFIRPVDGQPDLFAFTYSFGLSPEGKADPGSITLDPDSITELEDGDLLIEGWAANFEGLDRQNENFMEGAFQRGIKSFLSGQRALCFHHKHDMGIGEVLDLQEVEGKGLKMKARVDHQPESSPLRYIYNAIKKGTYKGLSVGGFFRRKLTPKGWRIADMDFTEISVTPVPVHPGTGFAVVAGKALEDAPPAEPAKITVEGVDLAVADLERLERSVETLAATFEGKALPKSHDPRAAEVLAALLQGIAQVRTFASGAREFAENEDLSGLADEVESTSVKWEAAAHKLAAKIGPLPAQQPAL